MDYKESTISQGGGGEGTQKGRGGTFSGFQFSSSIFFVVGTNLSDIL